MVSVFLFGRQKTHFAPKNSHFQWIEVQKNGSSDAWIKKLTPLFVVKNGCFGGLLRPRGPFWTGQKGSNWPHQMWDIIFNLVNPVSNSFFRQLGPPVGKYGQIWLRMAARITFGRPIRVQPTPQDERSIIQPYSTSIQPISVSSGLLRMFNLVYAGFRCFWAFLGFHSQAIGRDPKKEKWSFLQNIDYPPIIDDRFIAFRLRNIDHKVFEEEEEHNNCVMKWWENDILLISLMTMGGWSASSSVKEIRIQWLIGQAPTPTLPRNKAFDTYWILLPCLTYI